MKTPWKVDDEVAKVLAEKIVQRVQTADEAVKLSQEIGKLCNGHKLIVAEMALGVVLSHIISEHPPEKRQYVFDRFCEQIIAFGDKP